MYQQQNILQIENLFYKMYPTNEELNNLYLQGFEKYKEGDYYLAHEYWEDLWHNKQIEDRIFIFSNIN